VKNKTNPGEGIDQAAGGTPILLHTTQTKTDHLPEDIPPQSMTILPPITLPRKTADPRLMNITLLLRNTTLLLLLVITLLPTLLEREVVTLNPHVLTILNPTMVVARTILEMIIIPRRRRILRENMRPVEVPLGEGVMNINPEEEGILLKNKSIIHLRPGIMNPASEAVDPAEEDTNRIILLKSRITKITMIMAAEEEEVEHLEEVDILIITKNVEQSNLLPLRSIQRIFVEVKINYPLVKRNLSLKRKVLKRINLEVINPEIKIHLKKIIQKRRLVLLVVVRLCCYMMLEM